MYTMIRQCFLITEMGEQVWLLSRSLQIAFVMVLESICNGLYFEDVFTKQRTLHNKDFFTVPAGKHNSILL